MSKEMIFVVGVESSGTRLLTKIFVDLGYFGDYTHAQRLDKENSNKEKIVYRRSIPHATKYPDILRIKARFKQYNIKTIITHRDFICNTKSKVQNNHSKKETVYNDIQEQYIFIGNNLSSLKPFTIISTSQLFTDPKRTLKNLLNYIEIDYTEENLDKVTKQINNPDLKWS